MTRTPIAKTIKRMLPLWRAGRSCSEIGNYLGLARTTIARIAHEHRDIFGWRDWNKGKGRRRKRANAA